MIEWKKTMTVNSMVINKNGCLKHIKLKNGKCIEG